jgi:hypothetical protein
MAPQLGLVLDCTDPELLAQFWSQAIGYTNRHPTLFPDTLGGYST